MLKVLIAEDNIGLAKVLENFLETGGYEVCGIASSVSEAVSLANFHQPDIAVLDYRMAEGEYGSQIRRRLKDKSTLGILYMSGDPLDKLTATDGEGYIQKPYQRAELLQAVRIVHAIKTHADISSLPFPETFRLLEDSVEEPPNSSRH